MHYLHSYFSLRLQYLHFFPLSSTEKMIATCPSSIDLANEIIVTATDLEQQQMAVKCYHRLLQMHGMTFWRLLEETL